MSENNKNNFNCKNEELPIMAGYLLSSLERDRTAFENFSPKFSSEYLLQYGNKVNAIIEIVAPASENALLKSITQGIYKTFDEVGESINHLEGYLGLAKNSLSIAPDDFGISALRAAIRRRDAEDVLTRIKTMQKMIEISKAVLQPLGLANERIENFEAARVKILADKQQQYTILKNRATIVQSNLWQLYDLYDQMKEIMKIGKILFGKTDAAKTKEYTFNSLLKQVRHTTTKSTEEPQEDKPSNESSEQ